MVRALREVQIDGVATTTRYLQAVLAHPVFREAAHHTKFLESAADEFVQPIDINEAYTDDEDETASEAASAVGVAHLVDPDRADSEGALGVADPEGSEQTGAAAAAARPEITDPREYARLYRACSSTLRAGLVVVHATPPRDALA